MEKIQLGNTGIQVMRSGFGALPIQRLSVEDAVSLVRSAYERGFEFFDTARSYTDSELKLGLALSDVRDRITLATKTPSTTYDGVMADVETSLKLLKTDHLDILQLHNPSALPDPEDPKSSYAALLKLREQGVIRFIGITNHSVRTARAAVESGLYDTLQYPINHLSTDEEMALMHLAAEKGMPVIGMKALSGGLITNAAISFAFLRHTFSNVLPIWGIQRFWELDNILDLEANPPVYEEMLPLIEKDRKELKGGFCRGCGYCQPCPAKIDIAQSARMAYLLRRSPYKQYMSDEWHEKMLRIRECIHCNACKSRCPYSLDTPTLLQEQLVDYLQFYAEHKDD